MKTILLALVLTLIGLGRSTASEQTEWRVLVPDDQKSDPVYLVRIVEGQVVGKFRVDYSTNLAGTMPILAEATKVPKVEVPPQDTQRNSVDSSKPLPEQLKDYQQKRQQLTSEELAKLKHSIAADSPEIDVPEMLRDAEVGSARLLNKHSGKLYKLSGLILQINSYDVVIVIKNTELVCSFADQSWKSDGLRVNGYLYACGFFESYKREGDFKQISMANCSTIENFYKLRTTPPTEEEKAQSLRDWQADKLYKVSRDFGERKLRQGP